MTFVLSLANADLALRRTSITLSSRRCKAELRQALRERQSLRPGPRHGLAQPDHRVR